MESKLLDGVSQIIFHLKGKELCPTVRLNYAYEILFQDKYIATNKIDFTKSP